MNTRIDASIGPIEASFPLPKPRDFTRRWVFVLAASDFVTLVAATFLGIEIVEHLRPLVVVAGSVGTAGSIVVLQLLVFERLHLYRHTYASAIRDEFYYTSAALILGALPLLLFFSLFPGLSTSRLCILAALAVAIPFVGGSRAVLHEMRFIAMERRPRRVAVVGRSERLGFVASSFAMVTGTEILRLPVEDLDASVECVSDGGRYEVARIEWFARALAWECDLLVLTETLPPWSLPGVLQVAAEHHLKIAFAPPRFRVHSYGMSLEIDGEQALLVPRQLRACTRPAQAVKRASDIAAAVLGVVLAAPLLALCTFAIRLESPGPVFYRQRRVGLGGSTFEILKFRSMRVDAESNSGPVWAAHGDLRVTRVGRFLRRFSLDELPQLFNVLHGDMSIVGPRPERPEFVDLFRRSIERYGERHLVRPGITGWSQINMRRALRPAEAGHKLSYDLFYVEQWSLFLDAYIVVKTAFEFLFHGAA